MEKATPGFKTGLSKRAHLVNYSLTKERKDVCRVPATPRRLDALTVVGTQSLPTRQRGWLETGHRGPQKAPARDIAASRSAIMMNTCRTAVMVKACASYRSTRFPYK